MGESKIKRREKEETIIGISFISLDMEKHPIDLRHRE